MASRLVDFIHARLIEDESAALSLADEDDHTVGMEVLEEAGYPCSPVLRIGKYRALAHVRAIRAILEFHESWPVLVNQPPVVEFTKHTENLAAHMSQRMAWVTTQEYRKRFGTEPPTAPMLGHIAAIWSHHPEYDQEWADPERATV